MLVDVEHRVDVRRVPGHGLLGDGELRSDRGVAAAGGHQRQHLALALGEIGQRVARPPAATPPAAPVVKVSYAKTSGARTAVVLACAVAPCAGTLKLVGIEHLTGTKVTKVTALAKGKKAKTTKQVTLALDHYAIRAGATQTLKVTLSGKAAKLLASLGTIKARLTVTPVGSTTPTLTKNVTFTAPVPKRKPKKRAPKQK